MIAQRHEIMPLLEEYMNTQREQLYQFWSSNVEEWSNERQGLYMNGIVLGKFREGDHLTMQTLEKGISDTALQEEIRLHLAREIKERKAIAESDIMQKRMLPVLQKQYRQLSIQPIDDWIKDNLSWMLNEATKIPYSKARVLIYLHYAYYNYDSIRKNPYNSDINGLTAIYDDIFDKQSQFSHTGLFP